jgi:hypothetical protein
MRSVLCVPACSCDAYRGTFKLPRSAFRRHHARPISVDPQEPAAAAVVPFGAGAEEVSAWWASLSRAVRDGLIAGRS